MKRIKLKIFATLFAFLVIIFSLSGCRKASDNGKLDGQWQIMTIENVETGETVAPSDPVYICMSLHIVQLTNDKVQETGNMQYLKDENTIVCDFPYLNADEEIQRLQKWGLYSNPITLQVLKLDGSSLILKNPETIITCRRF